MSKIINVGRVTAYADAVKGGYQGTREEWERDLANLGTTAAEVEADRQEVAANTAAVATDKGIVEGYKDAANLSAQASAASAGAAHTDALAATGAKEAAETAQGLAESAKDSAVAAKGGAETAQGAAEAAVTQASGYADNASGSATAAAGSATAAAGSATDAAASATAAAGSADEAEAVLESIPEDYSTLSNDVTNLKSAINEITDTEEIPEELTFVDNEYVNNSGQFVQYAGWSRTDFIEVVPGSTIKIIATNQSGYNYSYDEGKQPVGSRWTVRAGEQTKTVGTNIKYIVLSGESAKLKKIKVYVGSYETNLKSVLPLTEKMTEEVNEIVEESVPNIVDQLVNPTAYLMKQQIPNYYFDQNETAQSKHDIGYLDDKINGVPEGYHFIFVTDTHWIRNAKQSTKLISYVRDRIGAKFVLFGGDILTAHNTDAIAFRCLCEFVSDYKNAFGSNFLPVVGNHDLNSMGPDDASHLTYSDLVPVFMQGCDSRFHYCNFYDAHIDELAISQGMTDEEKAKLKQYFRTCYWVDDVDGKTRYIIYNTGIGSLDGGSGIQQFISADISGSYEELLILEWIYEILMSVPEGYNVIFCSHIPASVSMTGPGGTTPITSVRKAFATLISSFKAKINASVYINDAITNIERWCPRSMTFDFRNAPNVGTVAVMGGHYHIDTFLNFGFTSGTDQNHTSGYQSEINEQSWSVLQNSGVTTEGHYKYEIPIIITQYDAYSGQSTSGVPQHPMTLGTTTEQCFDVVTICPNGDIALTRFGAGNDRYVTIE